MSIVLRATLCKYSNSQVGSSVHLLIYLKADWGGEAAGSKDPARMDRLKEGRTAAGDDCAQLQALRPSGGGDPF